MSKLPPFPKYAQMPMPVFPSGETPATTPAAPIPPMPASTPPATTPAATAPVTTAPTPANPPQAPAAASKPTLTVHPANPSVIKMQKTIHGFSEILDVASKQAKSVTSILLNRYLPELNKDLSTDSSTLMSGIQNIGHRGTNQVDGVWGPLTQKALQTIHAISAGLMQIAAKFNPKLPQPTDALNSLNQIASEDYRTFTDVGSKAEQATKALEELEAFAQNFIHTEAMAEGQQTNAPSLFEQATKPGQSLSKPEQLALQSNPEGIIGNVSAKGTNLPIHLRDIQSLEILKGVLAPLGITDPKEISEVINKLKTQQSPQLGF